MVLHVWIYFWLVFFLKTESIRNTEVSYNQPRLPICAHWDEDGTTFADETSVGDRPMMTFIDKDNTIFVADRENGNVKEWHANSTTITRITFNDLNEPRSLFVAVDKTIYVDNGNNGKVEKWTLNATESEIVMNISSSCYGLFIDIANNLYCSMYEENQVIKQSLDDNDKHMSTSIVAGNGTCGSSSSMLCEPWGIFVTIELNLYVADCFNHRIQLFKSGQIIGETLVGETEALSIRLLCPSGVFVDANNDLFIIDSGNNRLIRSNSNGFYCIIGCSDGKY